MTRHASAETLARFRGGSLRRGATRRVRAHLDTCARCRATCDALGEIPALLAATEAPPIPEHLAARIETALATESAHRAAGSPSIRPERSGRARSAGPQPGRPLHAARGQRRLRVPALRALAAGAVAVVVGGGVYGLTQLGGSGGPSAGGSAASAPRSAASPAHGASGGLVRPGTKAPAEFGPLVRYQAGGKPASIRPVQTATDYQPGRLSEQVAASLARAAQSGVSPNIGLTRPDQRLGSSQLARLSGCLSRVAGAAPVAMVDVAQFRGSAATVIATKATSSHAAQVWVVGPGCSRSASDILDHQQLPG